MGCFYPRDAWKSKRLNENGKRELVFSRASGFADMRLQVPCGKCDGCYADRSLTWAIRCYQEASLFRDNAFLTLTYDEDHYPKDGRISKKALQDFFKRLRHEYSVRYFACGEYGDQSGRAHYHALIFGEDFRQGKTVQINDQLYSNFALQEIWGNGNVLCAEFTMETACYVAGYVGKKIGDSESFSLMSRKPGIGKVWLEKYWDDISRTGIVVIEGKEYPVPVRYLQWMEKELEHVKLQRAEKVKEKERRVGYFEVLREQKAKESYHKQRLQERAIKKKV
ncbi:MAG: replication initiator protein [Microviridae sp.]|nr:MAG: replication initiator protein [Microviridae sp.]